MVHKVRSEVSLSLKRVNAAVCSNVDGPRDHHTERGESDGEGQVSHGITYMWNLTYGINEPIYTTETDSGVSLVRLCSKSKPGCNSTLAKNFQMFRLDLEKAEEPEIRLPTSAGLIQGFPGGSEDKASACSAGDLGSTPGSGRSPGERNGNPLQYSHPVKSHGQRTW